MPYPQTSGKGAPGVGVTSSTVTYQVGTSGDAVPTGAWSGTTPSVPKGQFLWTRTITNFSNSTTTTAYSVAYSATDGSPGQPGNPGTPGTPGADGVGVSSSTIMYQTSASATTPPVSGWSATMPVVAKGQYLWTKTATSYTDGSATTAYSLGYVALDGSPGSPGTPGTPGTNGNGISAAVVVYQAGSSPTTAPTGSWSASVPTVAKGQYLWARTVTTYTDSSTSTAYSVSYFATDGAPGVQGNPGTPGVNGTGVASSTVTYQAGASGTTVPTGTWVTAPSTVTKGQYLWSRVVMAMTDTSSVTVYNVAYQGADGSPGTPGTNGTSFAPQTPVARTLAIGSALQHTDTTKAFKVVVNVRATQTLTVAGLSADKLELRVGPNAVAVAAGGSGGFSLAVWESGITGIALMVGAGIQDGGQMFADVPAGWYFQVNRLAGTSATVVSTFSQSMSA